jgi:peptidoglycan/LPS O-acetylase OafA/YrhL
MPKLKALTALRFFAAWHVVVIHICIGGLLPPGPWWYENFAAVGYIGVNLFFVLSGYPRLQVCRDQSESEGVLQARFAQIYPAYALSLLVSAPFFFFAVRHLDIPFLAWEHAASWRPACWPWLFCSPGSHRRR